MKYLHQFAITLLVTLAANVLHAANPTVVLETSKGNITLVLYEDKSPITVENFLKYVNSGFYNDTIFHRVIPNFMIQGGGFTTAMEEKPTEAPIKNESSNNVHNDRGTIAMARTSDPDSASSQFFINVRMNTSLDYSYGKAGYAVFGEVTEGMNVVDDIVNQPTTTKNNYGDVPIKPIMITRAYQVKNDAGVKHQSQ